MKEILATADSGFDWSLVWLGIQEYALTVWTYLCALNIPGWVMLVLAVVVIPVAWHFLRAQLKPKTIIAFNGPFGTAEVTRHAASDLVRRACEGIEEIGKVSSTLNDSKKLLRVDISFRMRTGCKQDEVTRKIIEKVEGAFRETLNVSKKIKINTRLHGFINGSASDKTPNYLSATPDVSASESSHFQPLAQSQPSYDTQLDKPADSWKKPFSTAKGDKSKTENTSEKLTSDKEDKQLTLLADNRDAPVELKPGKAALEDDDAWDMPIGGDEDNDKANKKA